MTDRATERISEHALDRGDTPDKELAAMHVEGAEIAAMTEEERFVATFPSKKKKRLLTKIDLHIIPVLISLYGKYLFHDLNERLLGPTAVQTKTNIPQ